MAYLNQPVTNSITFTRFFYLLEESDWKIECTKRVSVQHDKIVNCFALRDGKLLVLFSAMALILDKNFKEINSITFRHKLVSASKGILEFGDNFWLVFEAEVSEEAAHIYEGGEDPISSLI